MDRFAVTVTRLDYRGEDRYLSEGLEAYSAQDGYGTAKHRGRFLVTVVSKDSGI